LKYWLPYGLVDEADKANDFNRGWRFWLWVQKFLYRRLQICPARCVALRHDLLILCAIANVVREGPPLASGFHIASTAFTATLTVHGHLTQTPKF
jgi:hypothetical protein